MTKESKKIKRLIKQPFIFYGENKLSRDELFSYFKERNMSDEDIENLWFKAVRMKIIEVGVNPISDQQKPWRILRYETVFSLPEDDNERDR